MASTYSSNLAIELIGTGEQSGTWGTTTNTNLGTLIEQSISGYVTQAITDGSGANTTITIPNGATGVARNMFIEMTGALTFSTTSLIVPANKKMYFIFNNTTGGFAVTVKVSGQTGILVPNGKKVVLTSNGTDIVEAHTAIVGNATMGGTLGITGTTTAAAINASGTVAMAGAATIGTTLAVTGTSTMAAINASGLVAMAGAATVGTTLGVTGTSTMAAINASGIISAPVGSVGSPSFSFTGDTTLGMYRIAAQNGGLVASSGIRLQWDGTSVYVNNLVIDISNANANISRLGAGSLAIGTGAIGSTAGSLSLTSLTASGTSTMAAINASGVVSIGVTKKWFSFEDASGNYLTNTASGGGQGIYASATQAVLVVGGNSVLTGVSAGVTIPGTLGVTGITSLTGAVLINTASNPNAAKLRLAWTTSAYGIESAASADTLSYHLVMGGPTYPSAGAISTTNNATTYATSSDKRLKEDKGICTDISVLLNTEIHDFVWKGCGDVDRGVFAQDAILVNPRAVSHDVERDWWGADYSKYIPDLIVGWQNHEARLAALQEEFQSYKNSHP